MGRMMRVVATLALCAAAASCAGRTYAAGYDDAGWSVEGVIAAVEPGSPDTRVTVDVASADAVSTGRVVLIVSPATEISVERADGTSARGGVADLSAGARVRARHTGEEMRSLPPQYRATHIRVIPAR